MSAFRVDYCLALLKPLSASNTGSPKMLRAVFLLGLLAWISLLTSFTEAVLPRPMTGVMISSLKDKNDFGDGIHKIKMKDLNKSIEFALDRLQRLARLERNLVMSNIKIRKGSASHGQYIAFVPDTEAIIRGNPAQITERATLDLMNSFCNDYKAEPFHCIKDISRYSLQYSSLREQCGRMEKLCSMEDYLSPYRSSDGSCNHMQDSIRGQSYTAYSRLLEPHYLDSVSEIRRAFNKRVLPSARKISSTAFRQLDSPSSNYTLALMLWGQFVEHDLSRTAMSVMVHSKSSIECCSSEGATLSPRYIHPFCAPISVPEDDPFYSKFFITCLPYVRSMPVLKKDCTLGSIEQANQATHYLDGSHVYGVDEDKTNSLRLRKLGQLKQNIINGEEFLPRSSNPQDNCQMLDPKGLCFKSGDPRVNMHPQLTVMHTLWFREHNRVAAELHKRNLYWDDEKLFQEARRIVIAELQQITYNEWLPLLLGKQKMHMINKLSSYDDLWDASVSNSFATAGIRAITSLMDHKIHLYNEDRTINKTLGLKKYFYKPQLIGVEAVLSSLVRGLATQPVQDQGNHYSEHLSNYLYTTNGIFGLDLLAIDIQRGRDHGIPPYTAFRTLCGLPKAKSFSDFSDYMRPEDIAALKKVYASIRDVDLIVGGLLERPTNDAVFGPTLTCILADQFLRTRRGDRYFYSNSRQPVPFTKAQRQALEKVSLARIFCDNANIDTIQAEVFKFPSKENPLVPCEEIPSLDMNAWANDLLKPEAT